MAQIEDMRPLGKRLHNCPRLVHQRLTARHHVMRGQIALNAAVDLHVRSRPFGRDRIVQGHAINAGGLGKAHVFLARLTRETDDRNAGMARLQGCGDLAGRFKAVAFEIGAFQRSGPAVENLDHLGTGVDLCRQVFDGRECDPFQQRFEQRHVLGLQRMGRSLILGAFSGNHIGGHGPRRAGKSDQRGLARQCFGQQAHGLVDRRQRFVDVRNRPQLVEIGLRGHRAQPRAFAGDKPQVRAQRLRHQ